MPPCRPGSGLRRAGRRPARDLKHRAPRRCHSVRQRTRRERTLRRAGKPFREVAGGPVADKEEAIVQVFFFSFLTTLISIGGALFIIMVIMKGINRSQEIKQQTYLKTLEKGVYDYRLIGDKPSTGTATLGWGIFFAAVGFALFISFIFLGIIGSALPGALIPLFIGIGLIIYYVVRKGITGDVKANGEPVRFNPPAGGEPPRVVSGSDD